MAHGAGNAQDAAAGGGLSLSDRAAGPKILTSDTVFTATGADPSIKYTFRQITDPSGRPTGIP